MIRSSQIGLGTQLRLLLSFLDGELAEIYKREGHEFRPRFYPVFQLLMECRQASVSEITSHLKVSQPAVTQTLAEMKRLGLVAFGAGADRREKIVRLTPHALDTAQALQPIWDAVAEAAAQLDRELSHSLTKVIEEAIEALARKSFPERISEIRSRKGE